MMCDQSKTLMSLLPPRSPKNCAKFKVIGLQLLQELWICPHPYFGINLVSQKGDSSICNAYTLNYQTF
jgi:hypothetical protein